jgi:rhamnose utilization protein RhaD (predicted bifunctional aldolase and dehydrogenase)
VAKVGTSNPDRIISLKMLQCEVENNNKSHVNIMTIQDALKYRDSWETSWQ